MARILIIEDEDPIRMSLQRLLEHAGYEVDVASDGEEGIGRHRRQPADLIITDLLMPEKEGLETIQEFRRNFPQVKIIAISGAGFKYLPMASEFGASRTFSKPLEYDELLEAIEELLS